jgi:hypothetical protein
MALSLVCRRAMLDAQFHNGTVYGSLHTASGGEDGSNEIAASGRVLLSFAAADASAVTATDADATFAAMTGTVTPTHVGLWSAVSAGTWLGEMLIADAQALDAGESAVFGAGTISVTAE